MMFLPDVEQKLGFDLLRQRLNNYCLSGLVLREVEKINFSRDFKDSKPRLLLVSEFKQILEKAETFPSHHFFDAEECLHTAAIEDSFLEAEDLLRIGQSLATVFECKAFLDKTVDFYPELHWLGAEVKLSREVPSSLLSKIDEAGKVKDHASVELARLRKLLREEQLRVRRITDQLFRE